MTDRHQSKDGQFRQSTLITLMIWYSCDITACVCVWSLIFQSQYTDIELAALKEHLAEVDRSVRSGVEEKDVIPYAVHVLTDATRNALVGVKLDSKNVFGTDTPSAVPVFIPVPVPVPTDSRYVQHLERTLDRGYNPRSIYAAPSRRQIKGAIKA